MTYPVRVLHADDEDDIREIVEMSLLLDEAFEYEGVSTGEALLERVRISAPDLILLDVSMPVLDGPTVFKRLQENPDLKHIPVIFVTARTAAHEQSSLRDLGALGILSKPFDPLRLADQVRELYDSLKS